jgi:glycosyltransferase involved in cell wall biosynthesis
LESVVSQTQLPERWVITDDGSTDRTAEIVEGYAQKVSWITLVRHPKREGRNFGAKAKSVNGALESLKSLDFDVLGNLDADTSFPPDYMAFLLQKFSEDPKLGVAGTPFTQEGGFDSTRDSFEGENYVPGPIQLFRRTCFREIGGYVVSPSGGVDWIAVMTARLKGWTAKSFDEKRFHHHRSMGGTAEKGTVGALFVYGKRAYYLGWSPLWQICRVIYRLPHRPYIVGGLALLFGYVWGALKRTPRPVSQELIQFHRAEQMSRLKAILYSVIRFKKLDRFHVSGEAN